MRNPLRDALARSARLLVISAVSIFSVCAAAEAQTSVVISQVFGGNSTSAPYNEDYVELFNPTAAAVSVSGWGVQYAAAAGVSYSVVTLPSVSIGPGQYFLVGLASTTGGTSLPTPDFTGGTNISGTAGKVYLTSNATSLTASVTNGCPVSPAIVDYVGYGSTATCFRGAGPAPVITSSQAEIKASVCAAPASTATDFSAGVPAPHNSSSTGVTCGASTPLSGTGLATPASVYQGLTALLTVKVVPASAPASSGILVSADLSGIGGSSTQPFSDDGMNGDAVAGDGVYSYRTTVPANAPTGAISLPVRVMDAQARTAATTIGLTVAVPPPVVTVRSIQSAKPSLYATQTVTTMGVVVSVKTNGFYLEAQDADGSPTTPEGVLVYTGTAPPAMVVVGELLQLTGVVATYPTTSKTPGTEIDSPTNYVVVQGSVPLPTPVTITAAMDSPAVGLTQFSKYEGMRVAIGSLTTTSGTDASLNEQTETNTSNGQFYGVVTGVPRPFREPGLSVTEPVLPAGVTVCPLGTAPGSCIPQWDSNPELIEIDSAATGGGTIDLTSNTTVTNVVGVMDFSSGAPLIVLDKTNRPTVSGGMTPMAVPAKAATEFTVASFNMERFYNDVADADNPGSSVVKVTTEAYQRRLTKGSLAIRTVLNEPDVIGVQEIENINVLTDLANRISTDAVAAGQADPAYKPYLYLATDGTGINTGMLVKSTTVNTVRAEQFGLATTFTNSVGAQAVLNDRTPLVVHVGIKRAGQADYPVTVISVHQRSLINVDDTTSTGATVRLKREAQAEYLATLIQGYQAAGEHVVTVGDFNSFEFSDGYVDTLGVTLGTPVPAAQVATTPVAGLASPPLVDLVTLLPPEQRQSYVETGSAQVLDHVIVTQDLAKLNTRLVYAHIDADYPLVDLNDATLPLRISDHDPAVAYFAMPAPVVVSVSSLSFGSQIVTSSSTKAMTLTNGGNDTLSLGSIAVTGTGYTQTNNCAATLAASASCTVTVTFAPTTTGVANGAVTLTTNATTSPTVVPLTGAGGDLTIAATTGSATVQSGGTAMFALNVVSVGGYAGTVTFGCSGTGTGESCTVTPGSATLAANGTTMISATVSTTARTRPALRRAAVEGGPQIPGGGAALGGVAMAGLLGLVSLRRRGATGLHAVVRLLAVCVAAGAIGGMVGCSGGGSSTVPNPNGTAAGTQTITVTATSDGVVRSTTVSLTVQ